MTSVTTDPKDLFALLKKSFFQWADSAFDLFKMLFIPILLFSVPSAFIQYQSEVLKGAGSIDAITSMQLMASSGWLILALIIYGYAFFSALKYIADRLCNRVNSSLLSYYQPAGILGMLGLFFITLGMLFVSIIPIVIGLIFLLIPGIALAILLGTSYHMFFPSYLMEPRKGVFGTVQEVLGLIAKNWLQVLLAGLLMIGTYLMVAIPLVFIMFIIGLAIGVITLATGGSGEVTMAIMGISSIVSNIISQIGLLPFTYLFYGNLYLYLSGKSGDNAPLIQPTQPGGSPFDIKPVTSPLPPQDAPPPRNPGDNPWGGHS